MQGTIDGLRMHWRERGRGAAVLLIHAFPFHGGLWDEQIERLPDRWRWIAPDLRGFGRSAPGAPAGPLAMDEYADDLVALLDRLDVPAATVCGVSMGGYVAFALWRRHPDRVHAVVLCDTRAAADTEAARRARVQLAIRVQREGARAAADAMLPKLLSAATRRERPEIEARLRSMIESTAPESIVRGLEGLADRADSTDLLPTITVPTLVLHGAEDATVPVDEARAMAERIPGARLRVIEGAGHLPNVERPAAFDRELVHFLEATGARGAGRPA
ncbi:MAG TPA: alpha/beta fold hydrolase [Longimicrobiales bacterium]